MSLVGQYDMELFTTIFSLLYVPVPGFEIADTIPTQVSDQALCGSHIDTASFLHKLCQ